MGRQVLGVTFRERWWHSQRSREMDGGDFPIREMVPDSPAPDLQLSIHLFICLFIHPPIHPSIH